MDEGDEGSQMFAALEAPICGDANVEFVVAFGSQIAGDAT